MKILLIGARGQLGSEIYALLKKTLHEYIAFNSKDLDITNFEKVKHSLQKLKPRIIINASAYTDVDNAKMMHTLLLSKF